MTVISLPASFSSATGSSTAGAFSTAGASATGVSSAAASSTGASGSGKTVLLRELASESQKYFTNIYHLEKLASQGNKRSCVATLCNLWSPIRELLAKTTEAKLQGLKASQFSFNRKGGRCEHCKGLGTIPFFLPPLPPSEIICPDCRGRRFDSLILGVRFNSYNAHQILELSIESATKLFEFSPILAPKLKALNMIGLGYLSLGQGSNSLSGGEHRRIQLAAILEKCLSLDADLPQTVVLLDDPTAALHPQDAVLLQDCFLELRRAQLTMILSSHNPQMITLADSLWSINQKESVE